MPGDDVVHTIEVALAQSRHVVLVLSAEALGSRWVTLEWTSSLHRDPDAAARSIIPVVTDSCRVPLTLARLKFVDARIGTTEAHAEEVLRSIDLNAARRHIDASADQTAARSIEESAKPTSSVQLGGSVPQDSPLYVVRHQEESLHVRLFENSTTALSVWGPRQMGKSSMIGRALHVARAKGVQTARIDCSTLGAADAAQFLAAIADELSDQGIYYDGPPSFEQLSESLPLATRYFRRLFRNVAGPTIVALDEFDYIRRLEDAEPVLGTLRGLLDDSVRVREQRDRRATIKLLFGCYEHPVRLEDGYSHRSPFNIGFHFRIEPLDREELSALLAVFPALHDPANLEALWNICGGHPYLAQQAIHVTLTANISLESISSDPRTYIGHFAMPLMTLRHQLDSDPEATAALAGFTDGAEYERQGRQFSKLLELGLVHEDDHGRFWFANALFRVAFGK